MRIYGNYCGPNWSAGAHQPSVFNGQVRPINYVDASCRTHDSRYKIADTAEARSRADKKHWKENYGKSVYGTAFALGIAGQTYLRDYMGYDFSGPIDSQKSLAVMAPAGKRRATEYPATPPKKGQSSGSKGVEVNVSPSGRGVTISASRGATRRPSNVRRRRRTGGKRGSRKKYSRKGASRRRYKNAKRTKKQSAFNKYGVVEKLEKGGEQKCKIYGTAYVGHAVCIDSVVNNFYRAIVKKLFDKAGIHFGSWGDLIKDRTGQETVEWRFMRIYSKWKYFSIGTAVGNTSVTQLDLNPNPTFDQFAFALQAQIRSDVVIDASNYDLINFQSFSLAKFRTGDEFMEMSNIIADSTMIQIEVNSDLVIQNQTTDAANTTNILSVNANPLVGKHYVAKGWNTGFPIAGKFPQAVTDDNSLFAKPINGIIATASDRNIVAGGVQANILRKPPQAWQINASKAQAVFLPPGSQTRSKFTFKATLNINTLFQKLSKYFFRSPDASPNVQQECQFGFAKMFGLEANLNNRFEADILLGVAFELNQVYKMRLMPKATKCAAIVSVDINPQST